ncbi:hypothetical protein M673_08240 [Aureimonas sp. AU20]|uniref:hypothetical protein n=1 Tax=Aureimonas sp. AU20 TaxID=1349819 RepID=UPI000720474C|nr:hypothetical protein [Aureimonas sp. AU20]ALN72699.1 hypothetical protein M673_08240 [Aureimonas sp. AU20]
MIRSEARAGCGSRLRRLGLSAAALTGLLALGGCQSDVLPAVFGLGEGGIAGYSPGTLPEIVAHDGDKLLGQSASETGRCIYENAVGRRFRADCPQGYKP